MRLIWTALALALTADPSVALDIDDLINDNQRRLGGVAPRTEVEVKLAFSPTQATRDIRQTLVSRLQELAAQERFAFPRLIGTPLRIDTTFRPHAFVDRYLDTADRVLMRLGAAYRLRHRWDHVLKHCKPCNTAHTNVDPSHLA